MSKYTINEANTITLMLKDLSTFKQEHPRGPTYNIDAATQKLTEVRDFIIEMLKSQEADL